MAYTKKTEINNTGTVKTETVETEAVKENVVKVTERKYEQDDLIPCRSLVSGGLYIEGSRSKILYSWADYDDVVDVEYRDLIYMVRTHADKNIYEPRIVVMDDEFVSQNKALSDFYDSRYTTTDLYEIINLPASQLKNEIDKLPIGIKNAIKGIASTMIFNHSLDSVQKIKVLDEIFGTQMLLTLAQE